MSASTSPEGDSAVSPPASVTADASARARESGEEAVDPAASGGGCEHLAGQREREERGERTRAHGGQIAQAARQGAVADGFRRMPVAAEVAAFQREVGGDQDFVAAGRAQDRAVVADAEGDACGQIRPRPTRTGCVQSAPVRPSLSSS